MSHLSVVKLKVQVVTEGTVRFVLTGVTCLYTFLSYGFLQLNTVAVIVVYMF